MANRGLLGEVEDALGLVVGLADLAAAGALARQLGLGLGEPAVGELEEDQPQDRDGVLGRLEVGVGPQLVRRLPQAVGDVVDVDLGVLFWGEVGGVGGGEGGGLMSRALGRGSRFEKVAAMVPAEALHAVDTESQQTLCEVDATGWPAFGAWPRSMVVETCPVCASRSGV